MIKYKQFKAGLMILVILSVQINLSFANTSTSQEEVLENLIQVEMINFNVPGIAVSVVKEGKVDFSNQMGFSNLTKRSSIKSDTSVFQTGSIAKVFTTYALLHALNEKGISEDSKIGPYLPEAIREDFSGLTFNNVLTHTTGIVGIKADTAINQKPSLMPDAIQVVNDFSVEAERFMEMYKFKPVVEAGSFAIYSNVNMTLAGILIEGITEKSYELYVSDIIENEFDMTVSAQILKHDVPEGLDLMTGYTTEAGVQNRSQGYMAKLIASDDFLTVQEDMERFMQVLTEDQELVPYAKVIKDHMLKIQIKNDYYSSGRSDGFSVASIKGYEVFFQDGGTPGTNSRLLVIPEKQFAMFISYNSNTTELRSSITEKIIEYYFEDRSLNNKTSYEEPNLNKFIGAFTPLNASEETAEKLTQIIHQIRVVNKTDGLYIGKERYVPYAQNIFYNEEQNQFASFNVDDKGRLSYLIVDNIIYQRTTFLQSLIVEISLLIFASLFNGLSLLLLLFRWQAMRVNRIHDTPRVIVLTATLVISALIGLIVFAGMSYNSWDVIFGTMKAGLWINIFGFLGIFLVIPYWMMIQRGNSDFRWTGMMVLIFKIQGILNILLLIWLWKYNLLGF